jgi:NAD/NADP transhydrogenase beta subunit
VPIIDADKAKTIIAIKQSMNPGELYYDDKTLLAFGDAKQVLGDVVKAVAGEGSATVH